MKTEVARRLLGCHQVEHEPGDSRVRKAAQQAGKEEELRPLLEAQLRFDEKVRAAVDRIELPTELRNKIVALEPTPRVASGRRFWKNPALFAAVLSVVVTLVLLGSGLLDRADDFPGKEVVMQMIERARGMSGVELEPITPQPLGKLADWFAMNGVEQFAVPPELTPLHAVGCRVYKQNGFLVAQAAVEKSNVLVHVFKAADLGVKAPANQWQTFRVEDWAGAVRQYEGMGIMLALHGSESEMEDLLASLK